MSIQAISTAELAAQFQSIYGSTPRIFRAPGRINLIGEHTDYSDGFVMPAAIDFACWVAIAPSGDDALHLRSTSFPDAIDLPLAAIDGPPRGHWSDYPRGVAAMLRESGAELKGANLLFSSNVPLGGGMSSSAAIEVSTALALAAISGFTLDKNSIPRLCQLAEQRYTGTMCGIMDQFISTHGKDGHALKLDCRTLDFELFPLPAGLSVAVVNTGVRHELAGGEYNKRRADCEAAVEALKPHIPGIKFLRDATPEDIEKHKDLFNERVYRRARHVTTENARVEKMSAALTAGRTAEVGELIYASHASLRDDFEVSCAELDILVEAARTVPGVVGARMMGGGFGGCTINLIDSSIAAQFEAAVSKIYLEKTGKQPAVYFCNLRDGAAEVKL